MKERLTTFLLSFVSGFVDTAGFIALGGIFTAHVTGNFVLAGASIVRSDVEAIFPKLLMFPIFVAAVGATYLIARRMESGGRNPLFVLMNLEALFLCLFAVVGWHFQPSLIVKMTESQVIIAGALGVIAMAMQNAFMKLYLGKMTMTTVMTGNVTQFSIDLAHCFFRWFEPKDESEDSTEISQRLKKIGVVILGFLAGAIGGAILVFKFGLLSVLLAAGLILYAAFLIENRKEIYPN
jgi:uncharacterized membrane protein YoaK (UPF0700 family)